MVRYSRTKNCQFCVLLGKCIAFMFSRQSNNDKLKVVGAVVLYLLLFVVALVRTLEFAEFSSLTCSFLPDSQQPNSRNRIWGY